MDLNSPFKVRRDGATLKSPLDGVISDFYSNNCTLPGETFKSLPCVIFVPPILQLTLLSEPKSLKVSDKESVVIFLYKKSSFCKSHLLWVQTVFFATYWRKTLRRNCVFFCFLCIANFVRCRIERTVGIVHMLFKLPSSNGLDFVCRFFRCFQRHVNTFSFLVEIFLTSGCFSLEEDLFPDKTEEMFLSKFPQGLEEKLASLKEQSKILRICFKNLSMNAIIWSVFGFNAEVFCSANVAGVRKSTCTSKVFLLDNAFPWAPIWKNAGKPN